MHGFDYAYVVRDLVKEMTGKTLSTEALTDSNSVFNVIAKRSKAAEKRLQIDVLTLMESYDNGEINTLGWFPGLLNAADPLTCTG